MLRLNGCFRILIFVAAVFAADCSARRPRRMSIFDHMFDHRFGYGGSLGPTQNRKDQLYSFNSDAFSDWLDWSACDPVMDCQQRRNRTCLNDSWKTASGKKSSNKKGKTAICSSETIFEERKCKDDELKLCIENKEKATGKVRDQFEKCGTRSKDHILKISDGKPISNDSWPWFFQLVVSEFDSPYQASCGATLISKRYALTAAHCFTSVADQDLEENTWVETHDTHLQNGKTRYEVEAVMLHPSYIRGHPRGHLNGLDLAILRLTKDVTKEIDMPCLKPSLDDVKLDEMTCYAVGLGETPKKPSKKPTKPERRQVIEIFDIFDDFDFGFDFDSDFLKKKKKPAFIVEDSDKVEMSSKLMEVKLPIKPLRNCERRFGSLNREYHICAGDGDSGTCRGDSGGGIYCQVSDEGKWFLYAITSFGERTCGRGRGMGVYSSVPAGEEWVKEAIANDLINSA